MSATEGKKRTRGSLACDQCNYRRVKCRFAANEGPSEPRRGSEVKSCTACTDANLECTFNRNTKRRGPKWKTDNPAIVSRQPVERSSVSDTPWISPVGHPVQQGQHPPTPYGVNLKPEIPVQTHMYGSFSSSSSLDYSTPLVSGDGIPNSGQPSPFNVWTGLGMEAALFPPIGSTGSLGESSASGSTVFPPFGQGDTFNPRDPGPGFDAAESVVLGTMGGNNDASLLSIAPPLPETPERTFERLRAFWPKICDYIPVLVRTEVIVAYESGEHLRSLVFRALLESCLAMTAASELTSTSKIGGGPKADRPLVHAYLAGAKRCLSLAESPNDPPSLAGVVTAMQIFMAHEWLTEHEESWDYLQMSITRAQKLRIDRWEHGDIHEYEGKGRLFRVTRLKILYLLCLLERSHALLRPRAIAFNQPLRLPGRPWLSTASFRASIPETALQPLQKDHIRLIDTIDDALVECGRDRCGVNFGRPCDNWTVAKVVGFQTELTTQMEDALSAVALTTFPATSPWAGVVNLAVTIIWLQSMCFKICFTHHLLNDTHDHPSLRTTCALDLIRTLSSLQAEVDAYKWDVSLDTCGKVLETCLVVIKVLEEGPKDDGLRAQVMPHLLKQISSLIRAVDNQSMAIKLIKAVARIS